ncbi:PqqD family protein [Roseivirga pacifica]
MAKKQQTSKKEESKCFKLRDDLQQRQFGLDFGVYDLKEKIVFMMNPTASLILQYLSTGKPHDEIVLNIQIAYGRTSISAERIKSDLLKTVKFFEDLELIEAFEPKDSDIPEDLAITELQMTSLPMEYLPPMITGYSMDDLKKEYVNPKRYFLDTWGPINSNNLGRNAPAAFSDTWNPDTGRAPFTSFQNPVAAFSDTWNPDTINPHARPTVSPAFSDTWNPDTGMHPAYRPNNPAAFVDTWNPTAGRVPRSAAAFSDTWNPNTVNPYARNTVAPRFSDTWNPDANYANVGRHAFGDTWNPNANINPNNLDRNMVRFSDTWNPDNATTARTQVIDLRNADGTISRYTRNSQPSLSELQEKMANVRPKFLDTWQPQLEKQKENLEAAKVKKGKDSIK